MSAGLQLIRACKGDELAAHGPLLVLARDALGGKVKQLRKGCWNYFESLWAAAVLDSFFFFRSLSFPAGLLLLEYIVYIYVK